MSQKTALVIGANGYIGHAVASAFARAQYHTLGSVRQAKNTTDLATQNIVPVVGSPADRAALVAAITQHTSRLDVIISTTEQWPDYVSHFNDIVALLRALADVSSVRPLVIFTSGTKDYGQGELDGSPGLEPHTETTPLNPPAILTLRTEYAVKILEHTDAFDAIVTRPSNVHGRSSSYYGLFFELAGRAKERGGKLVFPGDARTIADSVHVDDCGEAYVALAEHKRRDEVAGQVFNISTGEKYETLRQIADALDTAYELEHKIEFVEPPRGEVDLSSALFDWTQWIGSEKIRALTGWSDKRPMFAQGVERYKREYEEAVKKGDENVSRNLARFGDQVDSLIRQA